MSEKSLTPNQDLSHLKEMFADYQKQQQQNKRKSPQEILAKYFVPRKNKEVFRILPPKGKRPIEEAFFHSVTTITAGGKKKYNTMLYCPAHNDPKVPKLDENGKPVMKNGQPVMIPVYCPLCAKYKKLIAKQDSSIMGLKKEQMSPEQLKIKENNDKIYKEAVKWEAKKFYIIRGIDRGLMKDGVKFWRFKHNYKNQGTLDKLLPILQEYTEHQKADFTCPVNGTDLSISMTDSDMVINGQKKTYRAISAISYRGKSALHEDPIVAEQWLEDDISWRDVFLPKKAPGINSEQYLQMVADGVNPYWDDSDPNNKRWVFPGHPELEEAANTRNRTFKTKDDDEEEEIEQASDLIDNGKKVTISNITEENVGEFKDDAVDVAKSVSNDDDDDDNPPMGSNDDDAEHEADPDSDDDGDFEDLPF